ncbi:MAG: ribbon-helix-helix protein, CopG family [Thermomicrobiales bacterium]|nr:ribbon-helix-helix protein, CopG family [Thermomicrobiales bacterium]
MERTTVYLPGDLRASLRAAAERDGASESDFIREALTLYLRQRERPWPTSFGSASSGEVHAVDIDDWLDENLRRD